MTTIDVRATTQEIALEEVLPHAAEQVWKALTNASLMARWMMEPTGFEAVVGNRFTFRTTPAGAWDGTIRCEVLDVQPNRRLAFAWRGGDDANQGYGSRLDTVVTFTLTPEAGGTRLRLVHSGFERPRNETAYRNMSEGWVKVVARLGAVAGGGEPS